MARGDGRGRPWGRRFVGNPFTRSFDRSGCAGRTALPVSARQHRTALRRLLGGKRNMRLSHLAVACLASTALVLSMAGATAAPEDDVASERADVGIVKTYYNGVDDDLLTAGLGKTGLGSAAAPAIANPTQPTVQELRRLATYNNYRALIDPTPGGGYGTLYGPNVKADGTVTNDEGKIA